MSSLAPISPRLIAPVAPAASYAASVIKALAAIALALSVPFGMSREAEAQTYYTGTGSTGAWNTSRWSTNSAGPFNAAYVANSPVSFTSGTYTIAGMGAAVNVGNVDVASNTYVNFSSINSTYATGGAVRTLTIGSSGTLDFQQQSFSTAAGTGFIKNGSGVLALAGNTYDGGFTLNAGTVIARGVNAMGSGGALTLNGGVVASNATRDLAGKYTGGITIGGNVQFGEFATNVSLASNSANLTFSNNMALGAANRTLTLGNSGTVVFGGVIANTSGGITFAAASGAEASVSGAGRFEVTNPSNTFTGDMLFTGAEVRFGNNGSLGNAANNIVINGGRFGIVSGSSFTIPSSRSITVGDVAGTSISTAGSGTLTYNGVIANISGTTGSWVKQGGGTLSLGGSSTYTGATTIANGTIQLTTANNRLPTGTVLSLGQAASANLGTLDLGGFNQTVAGLASISGTNAGASTNLVTTSTGASTLTINVTSGSTYIYGSGSAQNSGAITGAVSLVKQGAGTQILGGSNSYTGPTTLSLGTLRSGTGTVGNFAFGTGTLALNGGTLTSGTDNTARTFANTVTVGGDVAFGDATATGALAFTGTVNLGGASRTLTTVQSTTFSGPISNGGLAKAGSATLTLGGSNSYSLGTTITSGSLVVGNANALGSSSGSLAANGGTLDLAGFSVGVGTLSGSSGASITSAGPATLTATSNADSIFAGSLSGSVAFTKAGTGLLTLSGSSNATGLTNVSSGTLAVNGTLGSGSVSVFAAAWVQGTGTIGGGVNVLGTLSPGNSPSPGVLTLGSVVLDAASNTAIEINGPVRGTDYDGVNITTSGGLTYGGTLSLSFGSLIGNDSTLDIFNFMGPSSGNYSSVLSTGSYAGLWTSLGSGTFQLVSGTQTLTFSQFTGDIIVVPEPAAFALVGAGVTLVSWVVRRLRGTLSTAC